MDQTAIFGPMLVMMGLTLVVWVLMYARRIPFLNAQELDPDELTPAMLEELSPPEVANPSDNLKNLFEMPVLFYAIALYLHAVGQVDTVHLVAAWLFVGLRVLHSPVHCTVNKVMARFALYALSSLALWFMVLRAGFYF
ncbi:MAG: MAPEG family protein [Pseudomonadota bacterium]